MSISWIKKKKKDYVCCFPDSSYGKESACNAGNAGSIPGLGRSPGEGNGNPPQYSCLENTMDRGAWWAIVHRVTKIWAWLSTAQLSSKDAFLGLCVFY